MLSTRTSFRNRLLTPLRISAITCAFLLIGSAPIYASTTTVATWMGQSLTIAATSQAADVRSEEKLLDLPPEKAEAFFAILAPNDVKVLVGRRNQGVHVRGTAKEVSALAGLAELMTRESGREVTDVAQFIERHQGTWDSESVYKLPEPAGEALLRVLAFEDVPVLVSRQGSGIGVRASKRDQAVIADIARIQQGLAAQNMHDVPEHKAAPKDDGNGRRGDRAERRRGGDRAERGRGNRERGERGDNDRRGGDRRGRELAEKVDNLEGRIKKLEDLAATLHSQDGHAAIHHDKDGHDHHAKKDGKTNKQKQAAKNKGKKKQQGKHDLNEVITMRYDLPPQHAENLFNLFAPADITDILIGRSGNTIEIRAARKHQRTIKQLVKMLAPNAKSEVTKKNQGRGQAQTG